MNQEEAERVRAIFELYLEKESLVETVRELNRRRWTTKAWITKTRPGLANHALADITYRNFEMVGPPLMPLAASNAGNSSASSASKCAFIWSWKRSKAGVAAAQSPP